MRIHPQYTYLTRSFLACAPRAGNGGGGLDASWEAACQEFAELCRRNKRARQAAQAALLPQELAAAVDDGAKRRGGA